MDEGVNWRKVYYRNRGLVTTQQVLVGNVHWKLHYSDLCLLNMLLRDWKPLSIGRTL